MFLALHSVTASFSRRKIERMWRRISMGLLICKNNNQDPVLSVNNVTATNVKA